jgi:hypothetical protein
MRKEGEDKRESEEQKDREIEGGKKKTRKKRK